MRKESPERRFFDTVYNMVSHKILFFVALIILFAAGFAFLFVGEAPKAESITWGVNFSAKQGVYLNSNWKETYLALLEDLNVKHSGAGSDFQRKRRG